MRKYWIGLLLLVATLAEAQDPRSSLVDSLERRLKSATTDKERVELMAELAQFNMGINRPLSDEYMKQMSEIAEMSRDRELIIRVLLADANRYYNFAGMQGNINKGIELSEKAMQMAKQNNKDAYTALGYSYMARGYRANGNSDQALNYNNLALSIANGLDKNDSVKVICNLGLAGTYLTKNEKLLAFRHYLAAANLAEETDNFELMSSAYGALANFYSQLSDYEKAKDYRKKILDLTYTKNQAYERLEAYLNLAKVYRQSKQYDLAEKFMNKSLQLSDTLKFPLFKLNIYGEMLEFYFSTNQGKKAMELFNTKSDIKGFMKNAGFDYYIYNSLGNMHLALKDYDSAAYYYKLAEPGIEANANRTAKYSFYGSYAEYYSKTNNYPKVVEYIQKASTIAEATGNLDMQLIVARYMDSAHQKLGNYQLALTYNDKYHKLKDSIDKLSKEKDLMLLEVDNENKRKEREAKIKEEQTRRRHNIQYMGITVGIAAVFVLLVMAGAFSVSRTTIKILGFFAFIFLFEFIILLADNQIHHWTHGEPWKVLAIKIGLIAVLLPLHHWLEEKVIHYLTSHKMLRVKGKGIFGNFFAKNI